MNMALTWQYVRDTELNMTCFGDQVENVRTLCFGDQVENVRTLLSFMEITRAGQRGEKHWRRAKKSW